MSGGVDSSVAALLLKEQGYEPIGLFMSSGIEHECSGERSCCSAEDARDARMAASRIGIPFFSLNFSREFQGLIDHFCSEYCAGRTPNPCIVCNYKLKFGKLLDYASHVGAGAIATGHYARIVLRAGRHAVARAADPTKDQSYVLFCLTQAQLAKTMFPLGGLKKTEVRRIAAEADLPVKDKPESQDICFVPDNDYRKLLQARMPGELKAGDIIDMNGKVLGRHKGYQCYTIGQRQGLGVAMGRPVYVVGIDPASNTVTLGEDKDLSAGGLEASELNWMGRKGFTKGRKIKAIVQIRYHHKGVESEIEQGEGGRAIVRFSKPQRAVTPGQAAVFYDNKGVVIGGGWIDYAVY